MSEVYVLVKQVSAKMSEGHFTIHGVTEEEEIADTWTAAAEDCYSLTFDSSHTPTSEPWFAEDGSE